MNMKFHSETNIRKKTERGKPVTPPSPFMGFVILSFVAKTTSFTITTVLKA